VVQSWLESRNVERRAMARLANSPVWYRAFVAPVHLTMGYLISSDDLRLLAAEPPDFDRLPASWITDPLNPTSIASTCWSSSSSRTAPSSPS